MKRIILYIILFALALSSCSLFDAEEKLKNNTPKNQQKEEEPQTFDYYPLVYEGRQTICINFVLITKLIIDTIMVIYSWSEQD